MEDPLQSPSKTARFEPKPNVVTNAKRSWTNLPLEMLALIAIRLSLIDLLNFRGTCKEWRTASSTTINQDETNPQEKPWLLLYEKGNANTQIILCNPEDSKKYKIDIPELNGARCLASHHGWLLLHYESGSLVLFSPFTRAKIELPEFPNLNISGHVAVLSAPPTSKECIICVISRQNDVTMDLHMLRRGEKEWKKIEYSCNPSFSTVIAVAYSDGEFYFLDNKEKLLTCSASGKKWANFKIVSSGDCEPLPFSLSSYYFREGGAMRKLAELENDVSVSTCGTVILRHGNEVVVYNEVDTGLERSENSPSLDGIWVHPRFCQISSNQTWSVSN